MELTADQLRSVAGFLEGLESAAGEHGVQAGADMGLTISMPGWAHSLDVTRAADGDYRLVVGSGR